MEAHERIVCRGHRNIVATHPTTFEITTEPHLTRRGNCIVGVGADKGASDLSREFLGVLAREGALLITRLSCGSHPVVVRSLGSPLITLVHPSDLVWRRSRFVCGRTIGIGSDHTAKTLPAGFISALKSGEEMELELIAVSLD
ncbi:MAG: DUF371 domain-containing protein [Methanoregulaceae archaeon]|nr:DUF371 domain-containing protein [Methanoregulaceae archaeon]